MHDYKQTMVWQEAVQLATKVYNLSDDLPDEERPALGQALRALAVQIPAEIAVDLIGGQEPRLEFALRLESQLQVLSQIYPALDTHQAEQSLSKVLWRLANRDKFVEVK